MTTGQCDSRLMMGMAERSRVLREQVRILVRQDVLPREQPLLDFHSEPAFQQDRFPGFRRRNQQLKILGVARPDLKNIRILCDHLGM
jgi:hypothetical protein